MTAIMVQVMVMTITCTMMAVIVYLMYKTTCAEREEPDYD